MTGLAAATSCHATDLAAELQSTAALNMQRPCLTTSLCALTRVLAGLACILLGKTCPHSPA